MKNQTLTAIAAATLLASAMPAAAAPVIVNVSGTAGSAGAYTGTLDLDVNNGVLTDATGTISIAGLTNAQLGLITTSTVGNETAGGAQYPVGFRANDGTDLFGADQNYPLDIGGLLFAVGTTMPVAGQNALINFYNDSGTNAVLFTGNVNGAEYYAQTGSLTISPGAVPEAATWAMMILGMGMVGVAMRRRQKVTTRVSYAV